MLTSFEEQTDTADATDKWREPLRLYLEVEATEANPKTERDIYAMIGLRGPTLRATIHALRLDGEPLASSGRGYWMARTAGELDATVEHGRQRATSIMEWVRAVERTRDRLADRKVEQLALL